MSMTSGLVPPPAEVRPRRPLAGSAVLLLLLGLFCATTHWGRNYPLFAQRTWIVWSSGRALPVERRREMTYDSTYPVLMYIKESTPPDAVILLPPQTFITGQVSGDPNSGEIPLLASPSSVYNFIYPRVPVHWGDPSPWKDRINYVLVWHHWGLDLVDPHAAPTEDNDIAIYPWPAGKRLSW